MENKKTPLKIEKEQAQVGDLVWVDGYSGFCQGGFERIKNIKTQYDTETGKPYKIVITKDGVYRYDNGQCIKGATAYSIFYYATYRDIESVEGQEKTEIQNTEIKIDKTSVVKRQKITEAFAWDIYNFINTYKTGDLGLIPLQEALDKYFDTYIESEKNVDLNLLD